MRRRAAAVAAAVLVVAASGGAAPSGASAQTGSPRLELASQTPWTAPGSEFGLRVRVRDADDVSRLELSVTVHRAVRTRSSFARTLEGRSLGSVLDVARPALADVPLDAGGAYAITLPTQGADRPRDAGLLQLPGAGVYPVHVELRERDGEALDDFTTHLVATGDVASRTPLDLVWVLPLHEPPTLRPDLTRRFGAGDRLSRVVDTLAGSRVPVVLAPTPETLAGWEASADSGERESLATLRRVASRRQVVARPYVPVDVAALLDAGLADAFEQQRAAGVATVERVLGVRPDGRVWVADGRVDEASLDRLARDGILHVVVPEERLRPIELLVTLAQPFALRGQGDRRHPALAADAGLSTHFRNGGDPVLRAHHFLADLAVLSFDHPAMRRGVVALPPPDWQPSAEFLAPALDGLASSPLVTAVTTHELVRHVEPATTSRGQPLVRRLEPTETADLGISRASLREAQRRVAAFRSLLTPENTLDDEMEAATLVAQTASLSPARRRAYLDGVHRRIAAEASYIEIPEERTITLTARQGEIPVTFRNRAPYAVRVLPRLDSDKLELTAPTQPVLLPASRSHTERFRVETRTSGAFSLRVTLESPEGGLVIGRTRFTIRSTAASGVAIFLSVGAGLFLLVWWLSHLRGRRAPTLVPT